MNEDHVVNVFNTAEIFNKKSLLFPLVCFLYYIVHENEPLGITHFLHCFLVDCGPLCTGHYIIPDSTISVGCYCFPPPPASCFLTGSVWFQLPLMPHLDGEASAGYFIGRSYNTVTNKLIVVEYCCLCLGSCQQIWGGHLRDDFLLNTDESSIINVFDG